MPRARNKQQKPAQNRKQSNAPVAGFVVVAPALPAASKECLSHCQVTSVHSGNKTKQRYVRIRPETEYPKF